MRAWRPEDGPPLLRAGQNGDDVIRIQDYIDFEEGLEDVDQGLEIAPHNRFIRTIYRLGQRNFNLTGVPLEFPNAEESDENFRRNEEYIRRKKELKKELPPRIA